MTRISFVATKDLLIDGRRLATGDLAAVIETEIPIDRLTAGLQSGALRPRDDTAPTPPSEQSPE